MTRFERIIRTMLEVHEAKNHDYSRDGQFGNFAESERINVEPWRGAFVRLQDKYTRACNLIARDGQAMVLDEKLEDTLLDLANYSVIVLCLLEEARSRDRQAEADANKVLLKERMNEMRARAREEAEAEAYARAREGQFLRWLKQPCQRPTPSCSIHEQVAAMEKYANRGPEAPPAFSQP